MKLGVIGGLGPLATVRYMELIIEMTEAKYDQDHIDMIVYSYAHIPDRTEYILGKSNKNPLEEMVCIGQELAKQGVDCIGIPCITANYFYDELSLRIPVYIIPSIHETGVEISKNGLKKVGIMATDGTIKSKLFQDEFNKMGMETILPDRKHQEYVMDVIYKNVKAGMPIDIDKFYEASNYLRGKGAEVIVLGCTELSLVKKECNIGNGYLDAMEVLAQRSVLACHGKLREKYMNLILLQ